jgi:formate-dependent nitrite reductase membrane component NrfD
MKRRADADATVKRDVHVDATVKRHVHVWTWPIAGYLFLGGLGAGMVIVASVGDLFFGLGSFFIPCAGCSPVALGLGSFLLVFELGRPLQFWRVFSRERAVLTFGAWMVVCLMVLGAVYLGFWFDFIPWSGLYWLRSAVAGACLLLGCGVMLYTGIELSSMKARVFWNTPALPILFALSGLLVGCAGDYLVLCVWPYSAEFAVAAAGPEGGLEPVGGPGSAGGLGFAGSLAAVQSILVVCMGALSVVTLISVLIYVLMMYTSSTAAARKAAARWLKGAFAWAFWGGLVFIGLVIPLLLLGFGSGILHASAAFCVIIGGVFLRFLVVYCDDMRELQGEALYKRRLPQGDEAFLKADW